MPGRIWDRIRSYQPAWPYDSIQDQLDDEEGDYSAPDHPRGGYGASGPGDGNPDAKRSQREIIVRFPVTLEDASEVARSLKARHPVVVNFEKADNSEARRMIDFLSGATFMVDGHMERVGDGIFLFTPRSLAIKNEEDRAFVNTTSGFTRQREAAF